MVAKTDVLPLLIQKKYFVDPNLQRTYDFDTGLVGPTVVHNFVMSPQQGYGQTPHGHVPAPAEFGQTATTPTLLHEKQVQLYLFIQRIILSEALREDYTQNKQSLHLECTTKQLSLKLKVDNVGACIFVNVFNLDFMRKLLTA